MFSANCGHEGMFTLRKSSSHRGSEDVWATGYKGDMFEVETSERIRWVEWWIQLGNKGWRVSLIVSSF